MKFLENTEEIIESTHELLRKYRKKGNYEDQRKNMKKMMENT
jgi:hypothetical protein